MVFCVYVEEYEREFRFVLEVYSSVFFCWFFLFDVWATCESYTRVLHAGLWGVCVCCVCVVCVCGVCEWSVRVLSVCAFCESRVSACSVSVIYEIGSAHA